MLNCVDAREDRILDRVGPMRMRRNFDSGSLCYVDNRFNLLVSHFTSANDTTVAEYRARCDDLQDISAVGDCRFGFFPKLDWPGGDSRSVVTRNVRIVHTGYIHVAATMWDSQVWAGCLYSRTRYFSSSDTLAHSANNFWNISANLTDRCKT